MHIIIDKIFKKCLVFGLLLGGTLYAGNTQEISISHPDMLVQLGSLIDNNFFLEELSIDQSTFADVHEVRTLLGLREQTIISQDMLQRGLALLFKKNLYSTIHLTFESGLFGQKVSISATGLWIVRHISLSGVIIGKDFYRHCYVLEPGDCFEEKKHYHALNRIVQEIRKDGYFQARVAADVVRDENTKTVDVHIAITLGKQFAIGSVVLSGDESCHEMCAEMLHKAQILAHRALAKAPYSLMLINKTSAQLRKYLMKQGMSSVRIQLRQSIDTVHQRVHVHFILEDVERRKFVFFGNAFFNDSQLQDVIASFGSTITAIPSSMVAQEITRVYHEKGFWQVRVEVQENNVGECYCIINEGCRAVLRDVTLVGARDDNAQVVKKQILKPIIGKPVDVGTIRLAIASVENWYESRGFLAMQLADQEYIHQQDADYVLRLEVREGSRSYLSRVVVDQFPALACEGPLGVLAGQIRRKGKVALDVEMLQEQRRWLLDHFRSKGYLQVDVEYELQGEPEDACLMWYVIPGPMTYFGKTVIQGLNAVPYELLGRELQYQEGNIWDSKKLQASLSRLKSLEVFSAIHMHPDHEENGSEDEQRRTVLIKLRPDNPFEIRLRAGFGLQQVGKNFAWGNGFTYKVGTTCIGKNLLRRADYLLFDADISRSYQDVRVEYRRPWFFSLPLRTLVKAYSTQYDQPGFVGSCEPLYRVTRQGFMLGMNRCFEIAEIMVNTGFEWLKTTVEPDRRELARRVGTAIDFEPSLLNEKVPYLLIEPVVIIDNLDNRLCPTRGTFTSCSLKAMIPLRDKFSQAYFTRLHLEQTFVIPLVPRLISALRLRFGHLFHHAFSAIMPSERFYLGGANSVRGYDTDLCPPLGEYEDQDATIKIAPCGGKTMFNINGELRFLMYRKLELAIFQDVGVLVDARKSHLNIEHLVESTGFGVRYNTPIGPVRFDVAWKWHTSDQDKHAFAWFLRV
ncbi:BamA/TamA family outer membrane protein, partial [Candidatus Dependentiae bacterium]|nr:BamA/TamA family outer membrane protein [Candidatus Dependentiae bacterium]